MAPSPSRSSRKDANALPSMSSTFWAIMILASLLIAYCRIVAPSYGGRETCIKSIRIQNKNIVMMKYCSHFLPYMQCKSEDENDYFTITNLGLKSG
ncbi:hypothetical protein Q9966_006754 [Columba livia]|nr:hypothetical protein Q9966_006754 [Columba livia]